MVSTASELPDPYGCGSDTRNYCKSFGRGIGCKMMGKCERYAKLWHEEGEEVVSDAILR